MATEYPTTVRIEPEIATDLSRPALLGLYAALWVAFTLGGGILALTVAEFIGGVGGVTFLLTVGLGLFAAGPVAARRAMERVIARYE